MPLSSSALQNGLSAIRADYIANLGDRVQELELLWGAVGAGEWSWERLVALRRQAHSLAGSASTFDVVGVGAAAQRLEQSLAQLDALRPGAVLPETLSAIGALVLALGAVARERMGEPRPPPQARPAAAPGRAERQTAVLIVEDDAAVADHLALQLEHFGYQATVVGALDAVAAAVVAHRPAAIIMDIVFPEGDLAGPQHMAESARAGVDAPVVFLSQRSDFEARLWALRAGGRAYLTKPADIDALVSVLDSLTGTFVPEPYRVLIVDDTRLMSTLYTTILRDAGMLALALNDPTQIIQVLQDFQPDLLLLDMYMPSCLGTEVAALIRQQAAFVSLPIVFLSGEQDREHQLAALDQGGDDFLTKPIAAAQLVSAVTSRARRARVMRAQLSRDGLTGLLTHATIKEHVLRELARAQRYATPLTVAMIDLDHFKQINDRYGHAAGDRVLKGLARLLHQRLRTSDSIGRYGGEEFLIVLPHTAAADALRVLDDIRARFATIGHQLGDGETLVTFSGGIATLGPGADAGSLLKAADVALYAAKHAGRNRIVCAPPQGRASEPGPPPQR